MQNVPVEKNEDFESLVPTEWRVVLKTAVDALVSYQAPSGDEIKNVDAETVEISIENIKDYPDVLGPLNNESWKTSTYIWMGNYWEVLVDLSTVSGKTSDLVLGVRVYSNGSGYEFQPGLVYVP